MPARENLAQIRYVTENYRQMQGLRWVPFGIALLLATPLYAGWQFTQSGILLGLWLLPVAIGVGLHWFIGAYYARTFGQVQPARGFKPSVRDETLFWVGFLVVLVLAQYLNSFRIGLAFLSLGGFFTVVPYLWRSGGLRTRIHWLILSAMVAIVNLPLLLMQPAGWSDRAYLAVWVASIGLSMIVGGLLDHRQLTQTFMPVPEEPRAQTV